MNSTILTGTVARQVHCGRCCFHCYDLDHARCKWEISDGFSYNRAMLGDRKGPTMKPASKSGPAGGSKNAPAGIPELIAALASSSPVARKKAREALVALGGPAVPTLIQLLSHRQPHVRWEAAKALGAIADPIAASALVNALEDRDGDVRWLAAEGLAALGRDALQPLLAALMERSDRDWLCEGAHHVCRASSRRRGSPRSFDRCWQCWRDTSANSRHLRLPMPPYRG